LSAGDEALNPEEQEIVRASFAKIAAQADMTAAMFYARVFVTDPNLRSLFKIDMIEQGRKLMQMLAMVVDNLHQFEAIRPTIQDLGRRHERLRRQAGRLRYARDVAALGLRKGARRRLHPGRSQRLGEVLSNARRRDDGGGFRLSGRDTDDTNGVLPRHAGDTHRRQSSELLTTREPRSRWLTRRL
jgi:hypothetical protein